MKKFFLFHIVFVISFITFSQTPQYFKYQALVRDSLGAILPDTEVEIQISLLEGSPNGIAKYVELHQDTTNPFGLVNLNIGSGTVVAGNFSDLEWGDSLYFIKTELEVYGSDTLELMGISQILSVPIAIYSQTTGDTTRWRKENGYINYNRGNVGIGTSLPESLLHLSKNCTLSSETSGVKISNTSSDGNAWFFGIDPLYNQTGIAFKSDSTTGLPSMFMTKEGKVGIRTIDPKHTLDVEGSIYASQGLHFPDSTFINSATSFWTGYDNCVFQEEGSVVIGSSSCSQYKLAISPDSTGKAFSITDISQLDEDGAFNILFPTGKISHLGYFNTLADQKYGYGLHLTQNAETDTISKWAGLYIDNAYPDTNRFAAIFKSGNVGIGTDSPKHTLDVEGSIYASQGLYFPDSTFINSATSYWAGDDNCVFQEEGSVVIGSSSCSQYKLAISPDSTGKAISISDVSKLDESGAFNISYLNGEISQLGYFNIPGNLKYGYGLRMTHNADTDTIAKWAGLYIDNAFPDTNRYAAVFKSGNVGIGTDSPIHDLHIEGTSLINGNLGINKMNPEYPLDLAGDFRLHDTLVGDSSSLASTLFFLGSENANASKIEIGKGIDNSRAIKLVTREGGKIQFFTDSKIRMQIRDSVVVLGRPEVDKYVNLDVNGKIRTQEVEVYIGSWWDCVFKDDYNLPTLSEVELYIVEHNHLPGIPSENEVLEKGVNLGEMNGLLLQKIEELTLYMIELKKQNDFLASEIENLKKQ